MRKKIQSKDTRQHFSIQIKFDMPCDYKTEIYKSETQSREDAYKSALMRAKQLWKKYKKFGPNKLKIVDELNHKTELEHKIEKK